MRDILATPGIFETAGEADIERGRLFRKRRAGPSVDGSDLLHQNEGAHDRYCWHS
jgi:hypothetical protein